MKNINFKHSIIFFNFCILISPLYLMFNFEPVIFCLFLIATKDINISLILTVVYIIFMQLIKDLNPVKKEDESKEEKTKYIDSCIELLNNVKQTL